MSNAVHHAMYSESFPKKFGCLFVRGHIYLLNWRVSKNSKVSPINNAFSMKNDFSFENLHERREFHISVYTYGLSIYFLVAYKSER